MSIRSDRLDDNAATQSGIVKWYDKNKGFGFISAPDLRSDVLLHENVLKAHCISSIADGARLTFVSEETPNGIRATQIVSIEAANRDLALEPRTDVGTLWKHPVPARVKWFDATKGYGFVNQFGSSEDIFIGRDALERSAMQSVGVGEALCVLIAEHEDRKRVHQVNDWLHLEED